jgi:hypothetical protein
MTDVTSATGGTLLPAAAPAPAEDADLDAIVQQTVTRITSIAGEFVRPRWQPNPPKQPEPSIDWCAISVMESTPDAGPYHQHNGADPGTDTSIRHEEFTALASFYGPHSQKNAGVLRDGLCYAQNREALTAADIAFVASGPIRAVPELVNQQWIRRRDMLLTFRRKITRTYLVRNIAAADIHLFDDTHIDETIVVSQ